jgi:hypothetical protein
MRAGGKVKKIDNPEKCGIGRGAECCIFLTIGSGFECQRHGELRDYLMSRVMSAKRNPIEPFPHCQIPI